MTRRFAVALLAGLPLAGAEPVLEAWIVNPAPAATEQLRRVLPEVHSVAAGDEWVEVRSAGISLHSFGALQNVTAPAAGIRELRFRIPRRPRPETGAHRRLPVGTVGVLVNGVPLPNHFAAVSWQGRNLWHFDMTAFQDDGALTVAGRHREGLEAAPPSAFFRRLLSDGSRHSPIIGYALDGYPIYGPFGWGREGEVRRMRSGYRVRSIERRESWPDGTRLAPAQYGPVVGPDAPLGTFAEDYEYVAGSGDLDEFNGRFARTPEYPGGTYAYFVSTDRSGRLAFPYVLAHRYFGKVEHEATTAAIEVEREGMTFRTGPLSPASGKPAVLSFEFPEPTLEWVHERPLHLLIVSEDLAVFDHVHPERRDDGRYTLEHTFQHGGRWRLWADFTAPGSATRVEAIDLQVAGTKRTAAPLLPTAWNGTAGPLRIQLSADRPLSAGADIIFTARVSGAALEPYLGAWGHFVLTDAVLATFIHAHPLEAGAAAGAALHVHGPAQAAGPPPSEVRFSAVFPRGGVYKLWAQFQAEGNVRVVPFVFRVGDSAAPEPASPREWPADAIPVRVDAAGFTPARIEATAGRTLRLVVTRSGEPNCGSRIVFPEAGIEREISPAASILIELPALSRGELRFACGMGMYTGVIVAR